MRSHFNDRIYSTQEAEQIEDLESRFQPDPSPSLSISFFLLPFESIHPVKITFLPNLIYIFSYISIFPSTKSSFGWVENLYEFSDIRFVRSQYSMMDIFLQEMKKRVLFLLNPSSAENHHNHHSTEWSKSPDDFLPIFSPPLSKICGRLFVPKKCIAERLSGLSENLIRNAFFNSHDLLPGVWRLISFSTEYTGQHHHHDGHKINMRERERIG